MKYFYLFISFLIISCAQQTILSGGLKDNKAPQLNADTSQKIVNFNGNHLSLEFNENIQLISGKRTFITNPEIKGIELIDEKNTIDLFWKDSLNNNTTYSFIFLNAIADITESNKINELKYLVTTGSKIDSGNIYGHITKYPENNPLENILIFATETNGANSYRTYSNSNGKYQISNLKRGKYILYCFDDENNNYLIDTISEIHGFCLDTIIINDTTENQDIIAYKPYKKITLDNVNFNPLGNLELIFSNAIDSCSVVDLSENQIYFSNKLNDKHNFYFKDTIKNHTIIIKSKNKFCDTIRIAYDINKPYKNEIIYKKFINDQLESSSRFMLEFNQRIKKVDSSLIEILSDSIIIPTQFYIKGNLLYVFPEREQGNYKMTLLPKSIIGIKNIKEDTSIVNFNIKKKKDLSSLEIKLNNIPYENSIIQIFKSDNKMKEIIISGNKLDTTIYNCFPGKYQLKIVGDINNDGYWSIGDLKNKVLPEPIINYKSEIELKKNWSANIFWDFKVEK